MPRTRLSALLLVVALAATACGSAADVASTSSSSESVTAAPSSAEQTSESSPTEPSETSVAPTVATTTAPSVPTTAPSSGPATTKPSRPSQSGPQVGDCYNVRRRDAARQRDDSSPVSCAKSHNAETFEVFNTTSLPSPAETAAAWRRCYSTFKSYVGDSATVSTLGVSLMFPGEDGSAAGESWMRCDALQKQSYNGGIGDLRKGNLKNALRGGVPDEFRGCVDNWPMVSRPVFFSSCRAGHQAELIPVSRSLGRAEASFPGRRSAKQAANKFCGAVFQDYVPETNRYYYYFPTRSSWRSGTHDTTCWALDVDGNGLPPI